MEEISSKNVCKAALSMAMSSSRDEENNIKDELVAMDIRAAAVDFGSDFSNAVPKILERAVVAARREGVIRDSHAEEGAVAGAAHEAIQHVIDKCIGLNLGGKIGIARGREHISVGLFFTVGLLNLNDVVIGLGHRVV